MHVLAYIYLQSQMCETLDTWCQCGVLWLFGCDVGRELIVNSVFLIPHIFFTSAKSPERWADPPSGLQYNSLDQANINANYKNATYKKGLHYVAFNLLSGRKVNTQHQQAAGRKKKK